MNQMTRMPQAAAWTAAFLLLPALATAQIAIVEPLSEDVALRDTTTATFRWDAAYFVNDDLTDYVYVSDYEVRWSPAYINRWNWDQALPVADSVVPDGFGYKITVTGLAQGTTYWFAVIGHDPVGGVSVQPSYPNMTITTPVDLTPPGTIADLTGVAEGRSIPLTWTAPGDDGSSPLKQATRYLLRYSAVGPVTDATFATATPLPGTPLPHAAGTLERVVLGDLLPSTRYWFAVTTEDEVGNRGTLASDSLVVSTGADQPGESTSRKSCGASSDASAGGAILALAILAALPRR